MDDYGDSLCSSANELHVQQNSDAFSKGEYILRILTVFVAGSPHLHLTFVAFCLFSVICKQYVKQYNHYVDQSEPLTRFRTDFMSLSCRCSSWKNDLSGKEKGEMAVFAG